nr:hypothetical protein FFPRI1PSEUD_28620 [Pseudomonas sp. FFPRI_1]
MKDIARESPEKSLELAEMLAGLRSPSSGSLLLVQGLGAGLYGALATALLYQASTPDNQDKMRSAVNSVVESVSSSASAKAEEV